VTHSTVFWSTSEAAMDDHWFLGTLATVKASAARAGGALSVVEFFHPPGSATPQHVHHGADEAFYVLSGSIQGYYGDQTWEAGEGSFVWLPRDVPHGYSVDDGVPVRTLAITLPGRLRRVRDRARRTSRSTRAPAHPRDARHGEDARGPRTPRHRAGRSTTASPSRLVNADP
jgi:quercetin dioxygenase-like cupin family protein